MTYLESVLKGVDWELLREQKMYLYNEACNNNDDDDVGMLYAGVVSLLDLIQDAVVADGIASAEEVFGEQEE
jgi:hypothetical protein